MPAIKKIEMKRLLCVIFTVLFGILLPAYSQAASIIDTKHNLSVSGPGPLKAETETRICIFCHTPHNGTPKTPLWNREIGPHNYTLYSSSTMQVSPSQPNGPSRLCLSCHDGMIALGTVLQPSRGIVMTGNITPGNPSNIGGNSSLAGDHPISFFYYEAADSDPAIKRNPPADLLFYNGGLIECTTCHDPHKDLHRSPDKTGRLTGEFLRSDNRFSALCLECHDLPGWIGSVHEQSSSPVDSAVFPVSPRQWPTWATVAEWGCQICHTSHSSQSQEHLLYYPTEAEVCNPCHGGTTPSGDPHSASIRGANVVAQTEKISAHRMNTRQMPVKARISPLFRIGQSMSENVTCTDCHNPHAVTSRESVVSNAGIPGDLWGVSGIDRNGMKVLSASYEYEICFKCHADYDELSPFVPRVISTTNKRLQFDTVNPSFHPVLGTGRNPNVPSLTSQIDPALTVTSIIKCTDCHSDDSGKSKGPHGSSFAPILRERYEISDDTMECYQSFALCYRCHDRTSILSDASFQKKIARTTVSGGGHSGHLAAGASCSLCHDPHGVSDTSGPGTGSHMHLINFDTRIVTPAPGHKYPFFTHNGIFAGSCTLVCHGKLHDNLSYPQ
jgi:predicted CXXCH cytochrome family protein